MKKLNLQLLVFRIILMSCMLTGIVGVTMGQQISVTGTITDGETNEPLPGVNIVVKGTFAGTVTNLDGEYTIELDNPDATLVISYIGYADHSEQISSRTVIDVALVPDRIGLDEVVVIGYGVIKKSDVTGAVSSVDTEEISKMVVSNAAQALQGRASGVLVTQNSGSPGDAFDIKIRGTGTINNSSPLYVVDGVIVENISHIPPDNIQSFEALKDAASSAIYGSRAANGVIIITTKTGSEGPAVINFSASFSLQDYWKKVEVMDPNEYMLFQQMGFREASQINKAYDAYNQNLSPEEMYRIVYENEPYEGQFVGNWLDLISQNGLVQKYSLSASGGSNKITYFVSGNIFDQKGLIIGSGYKDLSLLADVNFKITERLGIRTNINYSNARRSIVPDNTFSEAVTFSPLESTRDQFGLLTYTPYSNVMWYHNNSKYQNLKLLVSLDYKISPALSFQSRGAFTGDQTFASTFWEAGEYFYYGLNNLTTDIRRSYQERQKVQWENILSYVKDFNKHSINAVGAFTMEASDYEWMNANIRGGVGNSENTAYLSSGFQSKGVGGTASQWSEVGIVSRINYAYDDRYLLQANMRVDGSSRFINQRWGFFPSASLGWRISQEDFMNDVGWLDQWKLRIGWGRLGNNRIDDYGARTFLSPGFDYVYGLNERPTHVDGWAPVSIAYEAISWEKTTTLNLATDIGLFNGLAMNFDYFWKYTSDMLIRVPVVPSAGMDSYPFRNAGEVLNRGFETTLNYRNRVNKFFYDVSLNFSYIHNEVLQLGVRNDPVWGSWSNGYFRTKTEVGHPIGEFYGWVKEGVNETNGEFDFIDTNGDGMISETDRVPIGNPQPKYFSGLNVTLEYGSFDFSMFIQGVFKIDVWNNMLYDLRSFNHTNAFVNTWDQYYLSEALLTGLYPELNNTENALLPFPGTSDPGQSYRPSDFYIEDASYLRLKNIQLGYNLPEKASERLHLKAMRVYIGAMNLFTVTDYSGFDPEVGGGENIARGFDYSNYPQARSFTFGINLSF